MIKAEDFNFSLTTIGDLHRLEDLITHLLEERDSALAWKEAYREVANRIENEWRKRETWIGEKRPEMILYWIDSQAKRIVEGKKDLK